MTDVPKPTVYIETTIPSYLTAWPSRELVRAAEQQLTREWWGRRDGYDLRISEFVLTECSAGDVDAPAARVAILEGVALVPRSPLADHLADELIAGVPLPTRAVVDAFHIAMACIGRCRYLLTWNCAHIANATLRPRIEAICRRRGYEPPVICTPKELLGAP